MAQIKNDVKYFLDLLYPEPNKLQIDNKHLWLTIWSLPQKESSHIPVNRLDSLPGSVKTWIDNRHVYFGPGLRSENLGKWKAGSNRHIVGLPGIWNDIDILGPGHKEQHLPPTLEDAVNLAYVIPELPPSVIVFSGGGMYPIWLFKEVWLLENENEQNKAQDIIRRFEQTILNHAKTNNWRIDSVTDLRHVIRLPGSYNLKDPNNPKRVTILEYHPDRRYNPEDFEPYLADIETTPIYSFMSSEDSDFEDADLDKILNSCTWMKHCKEDAETLSEPEWYAMHSVVARCKDAEKWAHELSKPYPGYTENETNQKLEQAKSRSGPITCERVKKKLNPQACEGCPHNIKSPILLGRKPMSKRDKDNIPEGFILKENGVYRTEEDKEGNVEQIWTCSPLKVVALTRDGDNSEWGRLIRIKDSDGQWHEWAMPMSMLAGSGEEYRKILLSYGLIMAPGKRARDALHFYLSSCKPDARARCVHRIGWYGRQFVLPGEVIGQNEEERPVLQGPISGNSFRVKGDLREWKENVASYCVGNSRLILATSTALAGPILELSGSENGGIHIYGPSSNGKTTVLQVASSVLGGGGVRGFMQNWRTTDNGLEAVAARCCDATLCLDELGQADPKVAGSTAYMLANGVGKHRAKKDGTQRDPQEWRLLFVSTGEITLSDKMKEDNRKKAMAGQQVRVLDIPADAGKGLGIFETIHGFENGDRFARYLKDAASQYYGTAFREFLQCIVRDRQRVGANVRIIIENFVNNITNLNSSSQVKRAASRFGLIAAVGEMSIYYNILPWPEGSVTEAAEKCFEDWLSSRGGDQDAEEKAAVEQVMNFIEKYGGSRFQDINKENDVPIYRSGFVDKLGPEPNYMLLPSGLDEINNGLSKTTILKALEKNGMLKRGPDGKLQTYKSLPGLGRKRVYIISLKNSRDARDIGDNL